MLLKSRIKIEHTINLFKQFKRCQLRYDRYLNTFNSYVYLAALIILIKKTAI